MCEYRILENLTKCEYTTNGVNIPYRKKHLPLAPVFKRLFLPLLICFVVVPLFSQNRTPINRAIDDFAKIVTSNKDIGTIAVLRFVTNESGLENYFINTLMEKIYANGGDLLERRYIDLIKSEIDFSMTGYVSDEIGKAPWIGHLEGANTVIYGSHTQVSWGNEQMTLTAANTETGRIRFQKSYNLRKDPILAGLLKDDSARLWTIGASIGSSFSMPLVIGTAHGTLAPFRYSFLELGIDVGFLTRKSDENYFSVCPYAHYAFFLPFDRGGMYIGSGVGYLYSVTTHSDESSTIGRKILADGTIGANIVDIFDVSYTLRTNFTKVTNKFSVGYTYRFK